MQKVSLVVYLVAYAKLYAHALRHFHQMEAISVGPLRFLACGSCSYVPGPFSRDELTEYIEAVIQHLKKRERESER